MVHIFHRYDQTAGQFSSEIEFLPVPLWRRDAYLAVALCGSDWLIGWWCQVHSDYLLLAMFAVQFSVCPIDKDQTRAKALSKVRTMKIATLVQSH